MGAELVEVVAVEDQHLVEVEGWPHLQSGEECDNMAEVFLPGILEEVGETAKGGLDDCPLEEAEVRT